MLFDARSLSEDTILEGDLCIAGAGAAGIALAREFIGTSLKVILLESGGEKFSHRAQFLYRGENRGRAYLPLEFIRRRQLGGTTVIWSGRCRPLDEIDFEARPWIPESGWPFSRSTLDPYYERAQRVCQLGPYDYSPGDRTPPSADLEIKVFQYSPPTDFGATYKDELERAGNIHLFLHASAVHLALDADGSHVSALRCSTPQRRRFQVRARAYILATGGLEVPRLLLASDDVQPGGVGNGHDLVGRYFMEHPHISSGVVTGFTRAFPEAFLKLNYESRQANLGRLAAFGLPESKMREERLLNACAFFVRRPAYKLADRYFGRAAADLAQINDVVRHAGVPSQRVLQAGARALRRGRQTASMLVQILQYKLAPSDLWGIRVQLETAPNRESRLLLSRERDALGMRRLQLHWKMSGLDLHSYHRFEELLFASLPEFGVGARRFRHDLDADGWPVSLQIGKHHMGTTRMHSDPRQGVVDENCLVHGTANLYVAGSSVFPTSGMANPTLTLLALAIRLADHLKKTLEPRSGASPPSRASPGQGTPG